MPRFSGVTVLVNQALQLLTLIETYWEQGVSKGEDLAVSSALQSLIHGQFLSEEGVDLRSQLYYLMWEEDTYMRISCPSLSFFLSLCLYIFICVYMHIHTYTFVVVRENMFPVVFFGYFFPPTDSNGTYSWQTLRVHRWRQEWLNPPSLLHAWNV